jgi:hypothetical protein
MTNEQILEKQVEALEKLLQLKEAVITELEAKVSRLQYPYGSLGGIGGPAVSIPSVWTVPQNTWQCTDGQPHTYPNPWGGTTSPHCTKCGMQANYGGSSGIITSVFTNPLAGQGGAGGAGGIAGQQAGSGIGQGIGGGFGGASSGVLTLGPGCTNGTFVSNTTAVGSTLNTTPTGSTADNNVFALTTAVNK